MECYRLESGPILLYKQSDSALSRIMAAFPRGAVDDNIEGIPGVTHLLEHMFFKGKGGNHFDFHRKIESLGCDTNAFTYFHTMMFYMSGINRTFEDGFKSYMDFVLDPGFDEENLSLEKEVVVQEIANKRADHSTYFIMDVMTRGMFNGTNYSTPIYGDAASVREASPSLLHHLYQKFFFDSLETYVMYSGRLELRQITDAVNGIFSATKRPYQKAVRDLEAHVKTPNPIDVEEDRDVGGQVYKAYGYHFNGYSLDSYVKLELLAQHLTGGMSSPLMRELREEKGLVYYIASDAQVLGGHTYFSIVTEFTQDNEAKFNQAFSDALPKAIDEIDQDSFDRTKALVEVKLAREYESHTGYALISHEFYELFHTTHIYEKLKDMVQTMSLADFKEFSGKAMLDTQPITCLMR